jgi:hypothetical protein
MDVTRIIQDVVKKNQNSYKSDDNKNKNTGYLEQAESMLTTILDAVDYSTSFNIFDLFSKKNDYIDSEKISSINNGTKESSKDDSVISSAEGLKTSSDELKNTLLKQRIYRSLRNIALGTAGVAALYYAPSSIAYGGVKLADAFGKSENNPQAMNE